MSHSARTYGIAVNFVTTCDFDYSSNVAHLEFPNNVCNKVLAGISPNKVSITLIINRMFISLLNNI